jgi:cytochrome P450
MTATSTRADCPVVSQDISDWDFNQNPFPIMEQWRAMGPVVYNEHHDQYFVLNYRDCARALTNVANFSSQDLVELFTAIFGGVTMEAIDSPRHHTMRGVWSGFFQRDALENQRELIQSIVNPQVDAFVERVRSGETVDAIPSMTRAIPTLVIADMLGVEDSMHEKFSAWSDAMGSTSQGSYDPTPRGQQIVADGMAATASLNGYIAEVIKRRRTDGDGGDLVSMMVYDDFAKEMEEQEIIASNTQLVFAGNETTAKLMATTLVALGQHPDQRRAIVEDRSLIPQAFEEIHRLETLVQMLPRRVKSEDAQIQGFHLPQGASLQLLCGAGNRDPERWDNAHELDIFRTPRQHLGFGFGMHVCLGLNLARLEVEIWLNRLLDQLPEYELTGPIDYGRSFGLRGPMSVPISL